MRPYSDVTPISRVAEQFMWGDFFSMVKDDHTTDRRALQVLMKSAPVFVVRKKDTIAMWRAEQPERFIYIALHHDTDMCVMGDEVGTKEFEYAQTR
jgi:hypothetical protein